MVLDEASWSYRAAVHRDVPYAPDIYELLNMCPVHSCVGSFESDEHEHESLYEG